jgi:hypothetical protein
VPPPSLCTADAGPKSDDEWYEGDGDHNTGYSHLAEHEGGCIGSRHVGVNGPLNPGGLCPPQSTLFDAQRCDTPAFCGKDGAPFANPLAPCACPEGEFLRFDVSKPRLLEPADGLTLCFASGLNLVHDYHIETFTKNSNCQYGLLDPD